jgi:hypothetical protein
MTRTFLTGICTAAALLGAACVGSTADPGAAHAASMAPPAGYEKVSGLVKLPDFLPGLGTLYVQPASLPAGPFLAYDRDGQLVSTIYMIPTEDMQAQKKFDALAVGPDPAVRSVDLYYNAGHPGVEKPHYHVVLWHVAKDQAKLQ